MVCHQCYNSWQGSHKKRHAPSNGKSDSRLHPWKRIFLILDHTGMSNIGKERIHWTNPRKLKVDYLKMPSSALECYPKQSLSTWNAFLDAGKPAVVIGLPAGVQRADKLNFDETNVIAMFEETNFKAEISVRITSNILWLMGNLFSTRAG